MDKHNVYLITLGVLIIGKSKWNINYAVVPEEKEDVGNVMKTFGLIQSAKQNKHSQSSQCEVERVQQHKQSPQTR